MSGGPSVTRGSVSCDAGVHGLPIKILLTWGSSNAGIPTTFVQRTPRSHSLPTALGRLTPTKRKRKVQTAEYYGPEGRDLKPEI